MQTVKKTALLDVDGTLCPGALGVDLLRALVGAGVCDETRATALFTAFAEYGAGAIDFETMAEQAYRTYASALDGRAVEAVDAVARAAWATRRDTLFEFVPALLECLREHGYEPMLISGSPLVMVRLVADELGIDVAHGALFGRANGRYDGTIELASGMPGEKARIFATVIDERGLAAPDLACCFALGDSITDVSLFERVGVPLVFEPNPRLAALADARGWPVATRDDVVARVRTLLCLPPEPRALPC